MHEFWIFIKDIVAPLLGILIGACLSTRQDRITKKKDYTLEKLDAYDAMINNGLNEISNLPCTVNKDDPTDIKQSNRSYILKFKRQLANRCDLVIRLLHLNSTPDELTQALKDSIDNLKLVLTGNNFQEKNFWLPDENDLAKWKIKNTRTIDTLRIFLLK